MKTVAEIREFCEAMKGDSERSSMVWWALVRVINFIDSGEELKCAACSVVKAGRANSGVDAWSHSSSCKLYKDPDGWIPHTTGEQPVGDDVVVEVKLRNGIVCYSRKANEWSWLIALCNSDITHYRIVDSSLTKKLAEADKEMDAITRITREKIGSKPSCCKSGEMAWAVLKELGKRRFPHNIQWEDIEVAIQAVEKQFKEGE